MGDVLKAEHFEEAMRAEHLKAELPKGTAPAPTPAPAPVPAAQRTEKRDDPREQKRPAAKMKGWARLSPKFLLSASWLAVIEILSGAKRARTELVGAVGKARHRYDAPQS